MSDEDTFTVLVESELRELIPKFIKIQKEQFELIKNGFNNQDFNDLKHLGHRMKGACGGYGFTLLSEIGSEIEKLAELKDIDSLEKQVKRCENFLANLKIIYK